MNIYFNIYKILIEDYRHHKFIEVMLIKILFNKIKFSLYI